MNPSDDCHALISDLYGSVMDNSRWRLLVGKVMVDLCGADECVLSCPYLGLSADGFYSEQCLSDKDCCPFYEAVNPQEEQGRVIFALMESENFIPAFSQRDDHNHLSIQRIFSKADVGSSVVDEQFIGIMIGHVQSAMRMRRKFINYHDVGCFYEDILKKLSTAMLLLSKEGCILFANDRARDVIQSMGGGVMINNHLSIQDAIISEQIQNAVLTVAQGESVNVLLQKPELKQQWIALFSPLCLTKPQEVSQTHSILVLINDLGRISRDGLERFAKFYQLTPRETEVLHHLLELPDTQDIAASMAISIKTLRIHFSNLFTKTSTSSQRELAQLFLLFPHIQLSSSINTSI